jgi:hypothetical protein
MPAFAFQGPDHRRAAGFRRAAVLALALALAAAACQQTARLPDGRPFWTAKADTRLLGDRQLVVFMPDDRPPELSEEEQETYAGWARLLETFVARSPSLLEIVKVDFRRADEVFWGRGLPVNEFSLLLVRGDGYALFAGAPVFDPAAYDYAEAFLQGMEKNFHWPEILHMGEWETGMPPDWRLVRLRPGYFARMAPVATETGERVPVAVARAVQDPAAPAVPPLVPLVPPPPKAP